MIRRKSLMFFVTVFAVFAMAGFAFAANQANVNVTSEPVEQGSACAKAGGFSIEFDAGTVLETGDQITIDLNLGVTLCRSINLLIAPGGAATGTGWGDGTNGILIPPNANDAPIIFPTGVANLAATGNGVVFRVTGTMGFSRITVDILEPDANQDGIYGNENPATVSTVTNTGSSADDKIILSFLGQRINTDFAVQAGIYAPTAGPAPQRYTTAATLGQNTTCINVSAYSGEFVNGSMDSEGDKYTFIPSNPQIAHIVTAAGYQIEDCKGQLKGYIAFGTSGGAQTLDACPGFDNETGSGFCLQGAVNTHSKNRLIIQSQSGPFPQVNYDLRLDILVNGVTGDNGVYFASNASFPVMAAGFDDIDTACAVGSVSAALTAVPVLLNAVGGPVAGEAPSNSCSYLPASRAVALTVTEDTLNLAATNDYLWIDLPFFNYDLSEITAGDVVSVRVTLVQSPCTSVLSGDFEIGTFGCPAQGTTGNLRFPYFTASQSTDAYWDGIVIDNLGAADGTATITLYEQDGDVATANVAVASRSMYVGLLSNITFTQTSGSGTIGDAPGYILVMCNFSTDGFAMMGKQSTGESMGYLPRNY